MKKITKYIPNSITLSRGVLGFLFPFIFITGNLPLIASTLVWALLSDLLDGSLARILKAESEFGKKADPIVDKIFIMGFLGSYISLNSLLIIPLSLEILISGINAVKKYMYKKETPPNRAGKFKMTPLFITFIMQAIFPSLTLLINICLAVTVVSQIAAASEYIMGIDKENIEDAKTNSDKLIENKKVEEIEEYEEKELTKSLEEVKSTNNSKKKLIELKNTIENFISSKEEWERNYQENMVRKLKK